MLFGKLRPYLAKVARLDYDGYCVSEFLVLRPLNEELLSQYLEKMLCSKPVIDAINSSTFGAKMPRADWHFIGNMLLPLPPLAEQVAIFGHYNKATTAIDATIARVRRQVDLMQEYHARLIADVVTGKLDMREAAGWLPEEAEEVAEFQPRYFRDNDPAVGE